MRARFFRDGGKFLIETDGPTKPGRPQDVAPRSTRWPTPSAGIRSSSTWSAFPGGRMQAFSVAWDVPGKRWFFLYPGKKIPPSDWLHWTRNGQNWNGMCAECHSTNLVKGFDPKTNTYDTTWSEVDVSCEACHGPGSRHVAWAEVPPMGRARIENFGLVMKTSGITNRELVELCAPCHSRRTELGDYDHRRSELLDNHLPVLLDRGDLPPRRPDPRRGLRVRLVRPEQDVPDGRPLHRLPRRPHAEAQEGRERRLPPVPPGDGLRRRAPPLPQEGVEGEAERRGALRLLPHAEVAVHGRPPARRPQHPRPAARPDEGPRRAQRVQPVGLPRGQAALVGRRTPTTSGTARRESRTTGRSSRRAGQADPAAKAAAPVKSELLRLVGDTLSPTLVRATALSLLGRYEGPDVTAAFRRALLDEEPLIRRTAVAEAPIADEAERVARLAPLLADPFRAVRLEAASALAGTPPALLKPYQQEALATALADYVKAMEYSLDFSYAGHNLGLLYERQNDPATGRGVVPQGDRRGRPLAPAEGEPRPPPRPAGKERRGREAPSRGPRREPGARPRSPTRSGSSWPRRERWTRRRRSSLAPPRGCRRTRAPPTTPGSPSRASGATPRRRRCCGGRSRSSRRATTSLFALADFLLRKGRLAEVGPLADRMAAIDPARPEAGQLRGLLDSAVRRSRENRAGASRFRDQPDSREAPDHVPLRGQPGRAARGVAPVKCLSARQVVGPDRCAISISRNCRSTASFSRTVRFSRRLERYAPTPPGAPMTISQARNLRIDSSSLRIRRNCPEMLRRGGRCPRSPGRTRRE